MSDASSIRPVRVYEDFVLSKCEYFIDVQLWPRKVRLDPARWLPNFLPDERDHAVHLLSAFMYFAGDLIKKTMRSAFQSLSTEVVSLNGPFSQAEAKWRIFCDTLLVVHVTGEQPNDADSGYIFKRLARDEIGIPQDNIVSIEDALRILASSSPRPVLFVDDFVGTGEQFVATWRREYELSPGQVLSFESYATSGFSRIYYCPLICTHAGHEYIVAACPGLSLRPAHILSDRYSVTSPASLIWPDHLHETASSFILTASARANIPSENAFGYNKLGLCLAFEHGVPDATLPLFTADTNGWAPLIRFA